MPNRSKQFRRVKRRNSNKDKFVFTNDLNLIKPYAVYDICVMSFISRFVPNDVILYNENIGFALIQYKDYCPVNIQDDPHCLDFIYINENQRGKGHGKRLMNFILRHFQIVIHVLDSSLGFFEHISNDLGLEKINTGLLFGITFISTNLNINQQPVVNSCLGGCGVRFSGYRRYACPKCSIRFATENTDKELIKLNNSLRSNLKKDHQPTVIPLITEGLFLEILNSNVDPDFKKLVTSGVLWGEEFLKNTTVMM